MPDVMKTAFELLINAFQGLLFMYFTFGVFDYKENIRFDKRIAFAIGSAAYFITVTIFNYITVFESLAAFSYSLIVFIITLIFFNGTIIKKAAMSIIPTSCMVLSTTMTFIVISVVSGEDIHDLMSPSNNYRFLVVVLANLLFFLFLFAVKRIFRHHSIKLPRTEWVITAMVFSISIIIIALLFSVLFAGVNSMGEFCIWITVLFVIVMNIAVYYLLIPLNSRHKIELENSLLRQEQIFQAESMKEVKKQYDVLQKTRHDFANSLRIVQALNSEHKNYEIDAYISKYIETQNRTVRIVSTNNEYVNAIINSKLAEASTGDIETKVAVISDLVCPNSVDICNIIGNMFDNAITACKKCENERRIEFSISRDNANTVFSIKNTISKSVLENNPKLKTEKNDKSRHGYGTKIIRETAEKYHGFADFYEYNNMFCCNVIMQLDDEQHSK